MGGGSGPLQNRPKTIFRNNAWLLDSIGQTLTSSNVSSEQYKKHE